MTYKRRTDSNHRAMIDALREAGYTLHDTSNIGQGIPDAIMCRGARCEWLEIKSGPGCPPIIAWTPALAIAEFERREQSPKNLPKI